MAYIGKQPLVGNFVKLDTITTSATTTFNLLNGGVAYYPQSANNCLVSLNGILQAPTDSYTISGSTIIFSSALTTSDVIDFIIVLGDVLNIGTPSDGTVTAAKIANSVITPAKLAYSEGTLTDGATISWDVSTSPVAKVTLGDNRTLSAPTNGSTGQFISLLVIQDGTGSRTLTWNSAYEFASDTAPTLTTTANLGDLFVFRYNGTKWLEVGRNLKLTLS